MLSCIAFGLLPSFECQQSFEPACGPSFLYGMKQAVVAVLPGMRMPMLMLFYMIESFTHVVARGI